jgi:TRAP-type transport system small permease protein
MKKIIDRTVDAFLGSVMLGMAVVVFLQVFFRYALNNPLSWPEEAARMLIVWLTFVGGYMAMREKKHIGFNLLVKKLPDPVEHTVEIVGRLLIILFLVVFIWQGTGFAQKSFHILMPYTDISVGWFVYSVFPVSGILMLAQAIGDLVLSARRLRTTIHNE